MLRPMRVRELVAFLVVSLCLASCGLLFSFEDYDTSAGSEAPYGVRGTVDGLEGLASVTLVVLGGTAPGVVVVDKNGEFTSPPTLTNGTTYAVRVEKNAEKHACVVEQGVGKIAGADGSGVIVHCRSTVNTLAMLDVSTGPLVPEFASAVYTYEVAQPSLANAASSIVTARATSPSARIKIGDTDLTPEGASAVLSLLPGPNPIAVTVTAADPLTPPGKYTVVIRPVSDYLKASNTRPNAIFGNSVSISGDTLAVGSYGETSAATGVNGVQSDGALINAGAVYIFTRQGTTWSQQAYLKAPNTRAQGLFGSSVAISGDTVVVGATGDRSNAAGVDGNPFDTSLSNSGAAFVFTRTGTTWTQQAYLKASNPRVGAFFGGSVTISGDTIAMGSALEQSNATGVNNDQLDTSLSGAGAVYVFTRSGTTWSQQAYVKASNTRANALFGFSLSLSGDTLAVGSSGESSNAKGVNQDQNDTSAPSAGAVYVFTRSGTTWSQQAYLKASNTRASAVFAAVHLSGDTLVVGANAETSKAMGVNGDQADDSVAGAGAAYVFTRTGTTWSQQAYLKSSNTRRDQRFATLVRIAGDTIAVGAPGDVSLTGDPSDLSGIGRGSGAGAVHVFKRTGTTWSSVSYVKASTPHPDDNFGTGLSLSADTLAAGARLESSAAVGVNGNRRDTTALNSGAVFVFR
jgi:hypothetical protein